MIWILLPLTVGAAALTVGVVNGWWSGGEGVPALQPLSIEAPVAAQKGLPSLPSAPLESGDWPQVEKTVRQAMAQCGPSFSPLPMTTLHTLELPPSAPMMGQMECLLNWLKAQECVKAVRAPLVEAEGKTALRLLTSLPAQVEIEVDFFVADQEAQTRVLILSVDTGEHFQFISLRPGNRKGP